MKRFLFLSISFIVFLKAPLLHAADAEWPSDRGSSRQEILILNSYHPGYAWSDDEQAGIIDVFRAKDKNWLPVIEYLDLRRLPDGRHLAELKQLFRLKYQNKKFSVVIAMDNPALEFAVDNQAGLFGNAPIVFCGINNYTPSMLKGRSEVTGIVEAIELAGTIEVMLRLHPAAQEIFSPQDYTKTGLAIRKELEALVPRFGAKVRFRFTDPLNMEELLKELERLPKNSLVLAVGFITDISGRTFNISEIIKLFYEHSPVPIYSTFEQQLGFGIVGGKLLSARIHGANAGRIALRVLAGEKASAIPVVLESDSQFMFDYKVMSRFGIPLSALPEGSTVINKPVSFYAAHRVVIQTALGVIVFLAVVIFLLVINIIQRRRSAVALRESEERYRLVHENSMDAILLTSPDGSIYSANPAACEMLQRTEEEICRVGRNGLGDINNDARLPVLLDERARTGKSRGELTMIRKDGTRFQAEVSSSVFFDKNGRIRTSMIIRDVTDCRRAEEALHRSEKNFRRSLDDSPLGVRIVTAEGETIYANRAILDIYGYDSIEELNATLLKKRYTPESYAEFQQRLGKRKQGDYGTSNYEVNILRKDGEIRQIQVFRKEVIWNGERQFQVVYQDVTERRRAEENIRILADLIDISPLAITVHDLQGNFLYANQKTLDLHGYSKDELFALNLHEIDVPTSSALIEARIQQIMEIGKAQFEVEHYRKDGTCFPLEVFAKMTEWGGKKVILSIATDIIDRKQAEEEAQASREQMRALTGRLQAVREEERTRIAREIHDELGGALTGLKIDFSLLTRAALKIENETIRTSLLAGMNSMNESVDANIQTVRRIAMELRPGVLDDLGLVAALEWQLKDFEKRTGIRYEFFPPIEEMSLDADLSTALFRIFQEALTNVVRHSGATEVSVRLRADADSVTLEVEDNGKGIAKKKILSSKSLGLLGMRERAQMFGGIITVTGTPGLGTKVSVAISPVEKRKMDRDQEGDAE